MTPTSLDGWALIWIALGLYQFRRARRFARRAAEPAEARQAWAAHGYPSSEPRNVRLLGLAMILLGIATSVVPRLLP